LILSQHLIVIVQIIILVWHLDLGLLIFFILIIFTLFNRCIHSTFIVVLACNLNSSIVILIILWSITIVILFTQLLLDLRNLLLVEVASGLRSNIPFFLLIMFIFHCDLGYALLYLIEARLELSILFIYFLMYA
jgi:hypothetical protein